MEGEFTKEQKKAAGHELYKGCSSILPKHPARFFVVTDDY